MRTRLLMVLFALFCTSTLGNGGGYSSGVRFVGAFQPIGVDQVQMVSEDLEIHLMKEHAVVQIQYVLHNPGKKVKVTAGFPSAITIPYRGELGKYAPKDSIGSQLTDFYIDADGRKLKVEVKSEPGARNSMVSGVEISAWHVVDLPFDAGQTRRITVIYRQNYFRSDFYISGYGTQQPLSLTYLFSAAALWTGVIERGTVTVRAVTADPREVSFSHPQRFRREGDAWIWNFRDFEPTLEDDLVITTRPRTTTHPMTTGATAYSIGDHQRPTRWEVRRIPDSIEASSSLKEPDGQEHPASHATDQDRETSWAEGVPENGVGEWLKLKLKNPVKVSRVGLVNGYTKSRELFQANGRVAELSISVNGGKPFTVQVPDEFLEREYFFFDVPNAPQVSEMKLSISKVHEGTTFQDTCLSEVFLVVPLSKAPKISPIR